MSQVADTSSHLTTARGPSIVRELRTLYEYRELLWGLVRREIKVRYKNSILGAVWSLINPLIAVLILTYVYQVLMANPQPNYSAYLLAGYLPFSFFSTALMDSASSVTGNMPLISKIYFPREILPIASVISNLIHFLFALCIFFAYLLIIKIFTPGNPFVWTVVYLPFLVFLEAMFVLGLGFLFCALNTFFEDIKFMLSAGLWLLFFLTPVMYFIEQTYYSSPQHYKLISIINPLSDLINGFRKILLPLHPVYIAGKRQEAIGIDWPHIWYFAGVSFVTLIIGYSVFNRLKWRFAERP